MFEQSFTLTVPTDAEGRFRSAQEISSPFSLDVKISAALQSPDGITIHASFSLAPKEGPSTRGMFVSPGRRSAGMASQDVAQRGRRRANGCSILATLRSPHVAVAGSEPALRCRRARSPGGCAQLPWASSATGCHSRHVARRSA